MSNAIISDAILSSAIFFSTNLHIANGLTQQQLERKKTPLFCNVSLPENQEILLVDPDRDCDRLPKFLLKRYTDEYKTFEEVKAYVDKLQALK